MSDTNAPRLLSAREAADRTGLAPATLAKLRVRGGGPPFTKIGARALYPSGLLDEWINEQPVLRSTAQIRRRNVSGTTTLKPNGGEAA